MSRAELIVYATPVGPLADALDRLHRHLAVTGPTTAQEYPPHCTLTGFFRRDPAEIPRIVAELDRAVTDAGAPPEGAVRIVDLHRGDDWVGLALDSDWLRGLTDRFVGHHRRDVGDDALRPKDWLHLSIAYGVDDLRVAIDATADFPIDLPVDWAIALWQRHDDGAWTRHLSPAPAIDP